MSNKLNLLPDAAKLHARSIRLKKVAGKISLTIGIVWVFSLLVLLGVFIFFNTRLQIATTNYNKSNRAFDSYRDVVLATQNLRYSAKLVGEILKNRFEYSTAFSKMDKIFDKEVIISSIELKDRQYFDIRGKALTNNDMEKVEKQIMAINKGLVPEFTYAKLVSLTWSVEEGWDFGMEVGI